MSETKDKGIVKLLKSLTHGLAAEFRWPLLCCMNI